MPVLKADPGFRWKAMLVYIVFLAAGVAAIKWGLPAFTSYLAGQPPDEILFTLAVLAGLIFLSVLPWSVYMLVYALRILRAGQFPPPGAKVLRDTAVISGDEALARGRWLLATGIVLTALALAGAAYFPYRLYRSFQVRATSPGPVHNKAASVRITSLDAPLSSLAVRDKMSVA